MASITWKKKMAVLVGGTLLTSPLAMTQSYGNLLPYLGSYFQAHKDQASYSVDPLWAITMFRSWFSLSMLFTSPLEHRFGKFPCIMASSLVMCLSVLSGYVAVKEPLALTLTFGVFHGIGFGMVYPLALKLVLETMKEKSGTSLGFTAIGSPIASLVYIGLAYLVINPTNKDPDIKISSHLYFSDPDLIQRVPIYFLIIGSFLMVINILGIALMYYGSRESGLKTSPQYSKRSSSGSAAEYLRLSVSEDRRTLEAEPLNSEDDRGQRLNTDFEIFSETFPTLNTKEKTNGNKKSIALSYRSVSTDTREGFDSDLEPVKSTKKELDVPVCGELSPKQILSTRHFWLVWLCCLGISHSFYVHVTLYKVYGQLHIANDALLASIAMFGMIADLLTRPNVGILIDRFGIQAATFAMCALSAFLASLVVIGAHTNAVLFAVASVITFGVVSPQLMILSLLTCHLFGKTHYASNMGLVCIGKLFLVFLEPMIVVSIVQHLGWDYVFFSGSVSGIVAALAVVGLE